MIEADDDTDDDADSGADDDSDARDVNTTDGID